MFHWKLVYLPVKYDFFFFKLKFGLTQISTNTKIRPISAIFVHCLGYTFFSLYLLVLDIWGDESICLKNFFEPCRLCIIHHPSMFLLLCLSSLLVRFRFSREFTDWLLWFARIENNLSVSSSMVFLILKLDWSTSFWS